MSPNLYDLLDVEETDTPEQIRAAWKRAIADLDPTDRRFRAFNDAAGVLLDPVKRAAYDAQLADARADEAAVAEPTDDQPATPAGSVPVATTGATEDADTRDADIRDADHTDAPDTGGTEEVDAAAAGVDEESEDGEEAAAPIGPPGWALGAAAVAAVLAVALAVWVMTTPGARADAADSPAEVAERAEVQGRAALAAEEAAEQMVGPVLSYSYKTMAQDLERFRGYVTEELGSKQARQWPELTKEAEAQQVVVEAAPAGTALTRVSPDGDRATVVVFIDQQVRKRGAQPFVLRMWATMSLVEASGGEDRWLLDDICTDDSCA